MPAPVWLASSERDEASARAATEHPGRDAPGPRGHCLELGSGGSAGGHRRARARDGRPGRARPADRDQGPARAAVLPALRCRCDRGRGGRGGRRDPGAGRGALRAVRDLAAAADHPGRAGGPRAPARAAPGLHPRRPSGASKPSGARTRSARSSRCCDRTSPAPRTSWRRRAPIRSRSCRKCPDRWRRASGPRSSAARPRPRRTRLRATVDGRLAHGGDERVVGGLHLVAVLVRQVAARIGDLGDVPADRLQAARDVVGASRWRA